MRCKRKTLWVLWFHHVSKIEIRSRTGQPQLLMVIRKRRLQWFGHIQRMDSQPIPRRVYFWNPLHGKQRPDRSKTSWRDTIQTDILQMNLAWSVEEAEVAAKDRRIWKFISRQAAGAGMPDAIQ